MSSPPASTYSTEKIQIAAYLVARRLLAYIGCETVPATGRIVFRFADPEHQGAAYEVQLLNGAEAPALRFFDSYRDLRSQMTALTQNRNRSPYREPSANRY
jgi:hypothetical protein